MLNECCYKVNWNKQVWLVENYTLHVETLIGMGCFCGLIGTCAALPECALQNKRKLCVNYACIRCSQIHRRTWN